MKTKRSPALALLVCTMVFGIAGAGFSQSCTAGAFGPLSQDPLTVTGAWTIGNNCTLNFGFRHVILGPTATMTITNATIIAGRFTMQAGSTIVSPTTAAGSLTIATIPGGSADGSVQIAGAIDFVSNPAGGAVSINAGGGVTLSGASGRIRTQGSSSGSPGGMISITALGAVTVDGQAPCLDAHGNDAAGGMVTIQSFASSVNITKAIDVNGHWQGGQVSISAATTLTTSGIISAIGELPQGAPGPAGAQGGSIALTAGSYMDIGVDILANLATGGFIGRGGMVTLNSGGGIEIDGVVDLRGAVSFPSSGPDGGTFTATANGNYQQLSGSVNAFAVYDFGNGGRINISATGSLMLMGTHGAGSVGSDPDNVGERGTIDLHATGNVQVLGSLGNPGDQSPFGYALSISSQQESVTLSSVGFDGLTGSNMNVSAGRNVQLNSFVSGTTSFSPGSNVVINAIQDVIVSSTISVAGGGNVSINGCHVALMAGSAIYTGSIFFGAGGNTTIVSGDLLEVHGTIDATAAPDGSITLTTRVGAPSSPNLSGSTITPAPTIVHDNTMPPCLALLTTTLSGPSPLVPGATFIANLDSVPSRPVIVVASLALQHLPLGPLGWTQINPFVAAAVLADGQGALGPPIPGSTTDANGHWGVSIPTTNVPGLSGLTIYIEAYVLDANAANGLFHQPPYLAIQFL